MFKLIGHIVGDSTVLETPHITRCCHLTMRCNKYNVAITLLLHHMMGWVTFHKESQNNLGVLVAQIVTLADTSEN